MMARFLPQKGFVLVALMIIVTGCLSPATLRPVADNNSKNISNYNANVAAVANALRREAIFHAELEIQIARNKLARDLIQLPKKWLGPPLEPTSQDLANPEIEPYKSLNKAVDMARAYRGEVSTVLRDEETINAAVASKYPLTADIVMETPGFSIMRVLQDAFSLKKIDGQIPGENDPEVRRALMGKRNRLLDPYLFIQIRTALVKTYLEALEEYLSVVIEQGQVAASHANSISVYAHAKPEVSTLASALQDQELRGEVLEMVKKEKGEKYSRRVEEYLVKADDVVKVITNLSH